MSINPTEVPDSGPLGAFSIAYANDLARQGYAPASVRMQLKVLADLGNWLLHQGIIAGGDPAARLAVLSTYLGHINPSHTYWYLSAAPELLKLASDRLERHLGGDA